MDNFFRLLKGRVDEAELYYYKDTSNEIIYEDGRLKETATSLQTGYSLRVIKDNTLGFAYTKNLINPELLLKGAIDSLEANIKTGMNFPYTKGCVSLDTYCSETNKISTEEIIDECERILKVLGDRLNTTINLRVLWSVTKIEIKNTSNTNLENKFSNYLLICEILFPNTAACLRYFHTGKKFAPISASDLNELVELYRQAIPEVRLKTGRMKVLFLPSSLYALLWRLLSGTSGNNIYYKKSPIRDKIGEKIFSEKLTIYDDPLNDNYPFARAFDDEGSKTRKLIIIENGILKNFYYDLFCADKMGVMSTGNGYKRAIWGDERAAIKPSPSLAHLFIAPGEKSLKEIIGLIDRGIIVAGVLGAHSGNIINGDFSVGIDPCLYVEKGEIMGRVKNTMIAGNIYDVMKNVVEIGNRLYPVFFLGKALPPILFDDIMVVSS